jgi:hypothetical protein
MHHHDAPAVLRGPCRGAQPAVGIDGELSLPAVQLLADPGWVECPTLDDLNEHGPSQRLRYRCPVTARSGHRRRGRG